MIAVLAVVVLVGVAMVLVRRDRLGRGAIGAALAVAVVAAGTFAVTLYRSQTGGDDAGQPVVLPKIIGSSVPAEQGFGTAVLKIELPMSTESKYPQTALWLQPPRAGTDPYTGDLSLLCATPGKDEKVQNCTGGDQRVWSAEPLEQRATIGPAVGDPFTDPGACDEGNGVKYQDGYLELAAGKAYCLHKAAGTVALRIPSFPAEKPLPNGIDVEMAVLNS
ncbi:hypothetical protein Aab01nite_60410 [Paractinoplanes abujensis]|nr:hypothetical protein Aab01nite_60410 [Actinoplanes abujensis]